MQTPVETDIIINNLTPSQRTNLLLKYATEDSSAQELLIFKFSFEKK